MKWLILLLILLIPIVFVAVRYRRQLMMGWQMYQMYKRIKSAGKSSPSEKQIKQKSDDKSVQLIRCERCGSWIPQSEALNLRSKTFYCSAKCMERAVKLQSLVD